MENLKRLKNKLSNLENELESSQSGKDYTVSSDEKGNKTYNVNSEELKEKVFGEFRRGSGLNTAFLESDKDTEGRKIDFPGNSF
jgi:hypothetical protein